MSGADAVLRVTIVNACLRDGRGGSPTAVLDDTAMSDDRRRSVPLLAGTSHAVFVSNRDGPSVSLRFFTAAGELPACGHGTVAALAYLGSGGRFDLHASGRRFAGWVSVLADGEFEAAFDPGVVELYEQSGGEYETVLHALGVDASGVCVASVGRPRLLISLPSRSAVAALTPDFDLLRDACDRLGLLGCYVYSMPTPEGRIAARMFAPSIGVPEDIANANSTACLAAYLARSGTTGITVDMGDTLGTPATITATCERNRVHVGGTAKTTHVITLQPPGRPALNR